MNIPHFCQKLGKMWQNLSSAAVVIVICPNQIQFCSLFLRGLILNFFKKIIQEHHDARKPCTQTAQSLCVVAVTKCTEQCTQLLKKVIFWPIFLFL